MAQKPSIPKGTRDFSPAEMVDAGTAVFTLLDVSRMEVVADIPAKTYMNRGNIGAVTCRQSQSDGRIFPMQIVSIVPKADSNQLYRMRLSFGTAADSRITPGMNVEVSLKMLADSTQSARSSATIMPTVSGCFRQTRP